LQHEHGGAERVLWVYHRVSTVDQNPHAARKELRAAARRLGLHVALDVRETGSGANNQRPGLGV